MSEQDPGAARSPGDPGSGEDVAAPETAPAKKAVKKAAAKKAPAKKAAAKKTTKKTAAKKATKKAAAKTTAKKTAAKTAKKAAPPPPSDAPAAPGFPADPAQIDKPWLGSYPPLVPESYPYPDVPLTRLLDDAAKDFPDSVALDFLGRTLTYRRLLDNVDRFATALQSLGVVKGERVGIALPNCPQHVIAFFAVLRLGAVVVEIDPRLDERELAARINDTGCRVLVVLDPVYATVERLKGKVPSVEHVVGTAVADYLTPVAAALFNWRHRKDRRMVHKIPAAEGVLRFNDLVRLHPATVTQARITPADDLALLTFVQTASADQMRAVMLTHRNLLANVFQVRLWVPDVQAGRETILCAVPFWEPFGVTTCLSLGALSAAAMALVPAFDRDEVLTLVDKRKPTLFPATAEMIERLAGASNLRKHDLTSIRASVCNSSSLPADVIDRFEEATGGRLRQTLAVAEASAMTHANPIYGKAKTDRVGLPLSDTICALVALNDPTRLAAPGEEGRLAVYGPQVMKGYWNHPEHTAAVLSDGWLLTDFIAATDDDGYYCVTGSVS